MSTLKVITHWLLCCFNSSGLSRWVFYHCLISGANLCLLRVVCYMIIIRKKSELHCFREVNPCKRSCLADGDQWNDLCYMKYWTASFCSFKRREIYKHMHIHKMMALLLTMILSSRGVMYLLLIWIIAYSFTELPQFHYLSNWRMKPRLSPTLSPFGLGNDCAHWFFLSDSQELGRKKDSKRN